MYSGSFLIKGAKMDMPIKKLSVLEQLKKTMSYLYRTIPWDKWSEEDKRIYQSLQKLIEKEK